MEATAGVGMSFGGDAPPRDEARYRAEQAMARTFAAMQAVQGNTIVVRSDTCTGVGLLVGDALFLSRSSRSQVSNKQKGNPVLRHIRNVRWQARGAGSSGSSGG